MKRMLIWSVALGLMSSGLPTNVEAIPSKINYQGTLKEKGVPVNGSKDMRFRITNSDGTQVYWSSPSMAVNVVNGLFSQELQPTGVNWQTVTPFMEVSIAGQALTPREPINAGVYALVSANVTDGAITPAQVATGYGLVPSGMIGLFAGPCPSGWTRFTALDDRFPMGSSTYGAIGGSQDHTHSISAAGAHNHTVTALSALEKSVPSAKWQLNASPSGWVPEVPSHETDISGVHNHGGQTAQSSNLPPFRQIVFCQKN